VSVELANQIARRFIARADAKAKQNSNGDYMPDRVDPKDPQSAAIPWSRDAVLKHLSEQVTYGHYFLDHDDTCKLFAFDIDLIDTEIPLPSRPRPALETITDAEIEAWEADFTPQSPRKAWLNRAHPARPMLKLAFRDVAGRLASVVHREAEIECAVAYSGAKGVHVYGFTGRMSAADVREGALLVLNMMGGWKPMTGRASTYLHEKWPMFTLEVYPKQDKLSGGGFGNLMRLPLGKNLKNPKDPTFFVDLSAPLNELRQVDPMWALTEGAKNPWAMTGE
jgi:hypothetical protein